MADTFIGAFYKQFRWKRLTFSGCDPKVFSRLQWTSRRDAAFFYRTFTALYTLSWLIADLALNEDPYYYLYLTHWSQLVMCLYFGFAAFCCMKNFYNEGCGRASTTDAEFAELEDRNESDEERENEVLTWSHKAAYVFFNVFMDTAPMVTALYWLGVKRDLVGPTLSPWPINIHVHVINTVLLLVELTVGAVKFQILHICFSLTFGAIYLFFTLIIHWIGLKSEIYAVLNWASNPGTAVALFIGSALLAVPVVHTILYLLCALRGWVYEKHFRPKRQPEATNDMASCNRYQIPIELSSEGPDSPRSFTDLSV